MRMGRTERIARHAILYIRTSPSKGRITVYVTSIDAYLRVLDLLWSEA